jgi:hypothetical protein
MTLRQTGYFGLYVWARPDDVAETVAIVKIAKARMRIRTSLGIGGGRYLRSDRKQTGLVVSIQFTVRDQHL